MKKIFLIDGMAIAYRAYFAFIQRPLINSKGQNTSALYGFVAFLLRLIENEKPEYLAVAFDTATPTFRHKEYKEYKATREKMPEDMATQIEPLKRIVNAYGIPLIEIEGFEADDIIGTLARRAAIEDFDVVMVTPDKDYLQLINDRIKILKPGYQGKEDELLDEKSVEARFGVGPEKVIEVLALMGDKSDNIPGIPGIGEKTAIPLIQKYGSVENLVGQSDEIPQKGIKDKIQTHKELAYLSKRLVTIHTDVPLTIGPKDLKYSGPNLSELIRLLETYELKSFLKKVHTKQSEPIEKEPTTEFTEPPRVKTNIRTDKHIYSVIRNLSELDELVHKLKKAELIVFDTETTSTDALNANLVGISFSIREAEASFIPVARDPTEPGTLFGEREREGSKTDVSPDLTAAAVTKRLKPIFEDSKLLKSAQNAKYDMLVLSRYGIIVKGLVFDTMIANYLLRPEGRHNLDAMAEEHLNYKMVSYEDLVGTGKQQLGIREVSLQRLVDYACEDADITYRLTSILRGKLASAGLTALFENVEIPLVNVLTEMERTGVTVDTKYLAQMSKRLDGMLKSCIEKIYEVAGMQFNINSTKQLAEILFEKLGLPVQRKTKTGFSTDVGVLESLRHAHPIVDHLLEYRQLSKLKSTYIDALPKLMNPSTGRVHTSFNQTVAATGRLSSSDPNLQNIPIRSEIGREIRKAFCASGPDNRIISADYSQIELRIMAHISGDFGLREAFQRGEDIHATTAARVFGVQHDKVTKDMRRKAKEVNFGIMYGIGPFGLASRLEISQSEAKEIIDRYFDRFPKVKEYIQDTIKFARSHEYVETMLGRRRYLPDINSRNGNIRQAAERQAINMPIQGTAADMIKVAMIRVLESIRKARLDAHLILQVHDELVVEAPVKHIDKAKAIVVKEMSESLPLSVPVVVDAGIGSNWFDAH